MSKDIKRHPVSPDPVYNSIEVSKLINRVMTRGKKSTARKIVYGVFDIVKEKTKRDPLEVFDTAIRNASPMLEVKAKRVGGATYQVPVEVKGERKFNLAVRWMLESAKSKKGKPMREKLAEEILEAANNTGSAVRKRENTHKMAEANRAFAHFAW